MSRKTKKEPTVWIPRGLFLLSPAEGSVVTEGESSTLPEARLCRPTGLFYFSISVIGIYVRVCGPGSFGGEMMGGIGPSRSEVMSRPKPRSDVAIRGSES